MGKFRATALLSCELPGLEWTAILKAFRKEGRMRAARLRLEAIDPAR